jgi:ComF family protein
MSKESWFSTWASSLASGLFAAFFPSDCRLCNSPLLNISRLPVCDQCLDGLQPVGSPLCGICGERLLTPYAIAADGSAPSCGLCRRAVPPFARAVAYGSYEGDLRGLLHLLKYEQVLPAANVLGLMLRNAVERLELQSSETLVVPVPLHSSKLRQRGYNQAELIARAALRQWDGVPNLKLAAKTLRRTRPTASQTGLTRHQRRENLRGAFLVNRPERIKGREILLVDDVFTTGTTVSECTRILLRAGASKVYVATVARTMKLATGGISAAMDESRALGMAAAS